MYVNTDDGRRKINSNNNLKNNFASNSHKHLVTTLEKQKIQVSKQKVRHKQIPQSSELIDPKGSATINFNAIKSNQNLQNTQKCNKQFFQVKPAKKVSAPDPQNGIQINVNIQNIVPPRKNIVNQVRERSLSQRKKEQEKNSKKTKKEKIVNISNSTFDDFECAQQIQIKVDKKTQKKFGVAQKNSSQKFSQQPAKNKMLGFNDVQRQLKEFQSIQLSINQTFYTQSLYFLDTRQIYYEIDPLYIEKRQKNFTWLMRAILMDWMMHISFEFKLKRQTLHVALNIVDIFFQSVQTLAKADFQLSGAAAMFIAAKLQQFQPLSSKQFSKSTNQRYTAEQIRAMQIKICKTLKYNINPPTLNMWANKIMKQWDMFLESTPILKQPFFLTHPPKYFKTIDQDSYKNYRQLMQIIDCAILDIQTVQYKPKILVCSLMYLILGKQFNQFNKKKIITQFPCTSLFFLEETHFNNVFKIFLENSFGLQMYELLPSVQYLATYFILPFTYDRPSLSNEEQIVEQMNLEQYCSYQTYNPNMIAVIKKRFRGIYQ